MKATSTLLAFSLASSIALTLGYQPSMGFYDNRVDDIASAGPRTFAHETVSPQKIIIGCSGVRMPDGGSKILNYYFIDASGEKKMAKPGVTMEAVMPPPRGYPHLTRKQKITMEDLCFPDPCNAPPCRSRSPRPPAPERDQMESNSGWGWGGGSKFENNNC